MESDRAGKIASHLPRRNEGQFQERWSNHPHVNKNEEASTQVRTHQTCGNKSAEKICGLIALSPMNPWTAEEDEMLRMAVQRYKGKKFEMIGGSEINSVFFEMKNWTKIAECFKDRSDIECAVRWDKLLTLDLARSPWWREEDERMILLVKKYGQERWSTIAAYFPGRTEKQCRERWHNHINPKINKQAWTQDEELALIRAQQIYGNNWAELTKFLPGRWSNHPHVNKNEEASTQVRTHQTCGNKSAEKICGLIALSPMNPWTAEEDEMLRMAVQRYKGKKFEMIGGSEINSVFFEMKNWTKIAECFKDRSDIECAVRWDKLLTFDLARSPWWREEDERMILLVKKYGQERWSTIAAYFPGRTEKQCRERWHNHINPKINKQAWTQDEELALIRAQHIYGNNWAELTKFLPERTDNEIKNHWNSSVEKKLDMDMASGLLLQFPGLSIVSRPNHSAASSSPKAQQPSEDYSGGGVEVRSQGSNNIIA